MQVQSRERRGGRLSSIERYARDPRGAVMRGGYNKQSILVCGVGLWRWHGGEGRDGCCVKGRGVEERLAAVEYA